MNLQCLEMISACQGMRLALWEIILPRRENVLAQWESILLAWETGWALCQNVSAALGMHLPRQGKPLQLRRNHLQPRWKMRTARQNHPLAQEKRRFRLKKPRSCYATTFSREAVSREP